ncbi:hypothetical protein P0136_11210 [Lentisphaerota bacterium ZTH]|nr:hypothetical protein JYG24_11270 [Lentisphaerota bacterium]WET05927.1 hypothetical protein P0136_11210 [Lentisphaerota bacterium ZTH]
MDEWYVNDNNITPSKVKKYFKNYKEEAESTFANLEKLRDALSSGVSFSQAVQNYSFLRSEKKHVYRIGNQSSDNAHETRLYICVEEEQKIIYLLDLGDKNTQKIDINNSHKKAGKILA